ncbi:unnamed protein product [Rhizophagus irregularis]|nr:unnamed protein product [Rhizophagus irregularis]
MEQIKPDQIVIATEVDSCSSSMSTTINEKTLTKFEGSDDINGLSIQLERSAKRTELIQSTEKGSTSAKNPAYVEWYGINYSISEEHNVSWWNKIKNSDSKLESGKHVRKIIENIHGCANPGEVLAIMGPSGCGNHFVGDRVGSKGVQGTITLNGHKITKIQRDLLLIARLRLPREMSRRDKLKQVENTMALLNLTKCVNTIIGDHRTRGVSGGERKRANIASELLTDPSVILLDEPTSEFAVKQRKTIIMVIHQPSSQVFESFDKLMLMADGHMVYFGERAGVVNYLVDQGYKCHPNFNPTDYILELLNDNTIKQKLINAYTNKTRDDPTGKQIVEKYSRRTRADNQLNNTILNAPVTSERRWEATFLQQFSILTERTFKQSRKIILSRVNISQTIALTIFCILIWLQIPFSETNINDRIGSICFGSVVWSFYVMSGSVSSFPLDLVIISVSLVFMLATMLLGGFYIRHLPTGLTWLKYLSYVKYSYSLLMQIQFDSPKVQFRCARPGELPAGELSMCAGDDVPMSSIPGISIIENLGLNDLPWYANLIVLLGFCIVVRVLAYYSLRKNSRRNKE